MTRLDELLQQYCPDGVEYKKLGEIACIKRGVRVVRKQLTQGGKYVVYQNSLTPLGFYDQFNCNGNTVFIIAAGAAGEIGYSLNNFWAADDCFYFLCPENLNSRYLYHVLLNLQKDISSKVRKASIPRISRKSIEWLVVPFPPLPVQEEIVRILDRFDSLCNDLIAGLPAEIEARQKQYEYYRDKLLTFEENKC